MKYVVTRGVDRVFGKIFHLVFDFAYGAFEVVVDLG